MEKNLKSHSYFQHVQFYNVDFSKYSFSYRYQRCGFGAYKRYLMNQHRCHLNHIHTAFPSSDTSTPPHQIFHGQIPPFTNLIPLNPIQSSDGLDDNTTQSQVSIVSEVPSSTINKNSQAPIQDNQNRILVTNKLPGILCRIQETNQIHAIFPFKDYLHCPETGCDVIFISNKWSPAIFDLQRHLANVHSLPTPELIRWCVNCKITIP